MLVSSIGLFIEDWQRATLESRSRRDAGSFLFRQATEYCSSKVLMVLVEEAALDNVRDKRAWSSRFSGSELTNVACCNGLTAPPDLQELQFWPINLENITSYETAIFASNAIRLDRGSTKPR